MTWNLKRLFLCHGLIALLCISYFLPLTHIVWDAMDNGFFTLINSTLKGNPKWQLFWALSNHKLADWFHDIVFLLLITAAVLSVPKEERVKKISQFIFISLYIALVIFFVNRVIFRDNLRIDRFSPSFLHTDSIKLSAEIPWLKIKDSSKQSFPGDHGTTALLFAAGYAFYTNRKLAIFGWCYGAFICLPRLITGAHWLSDILLGSGCIALFFLSWAFYSPLSDKAVAFITRLLPSRKRQQPVNL